jgi:hypothetical protein
MGDILLFKSNQPKMENKKNHVILLLFSPVHHLHQPHHHHEIGLRLPWPPEEAMGGERENPIMPSGNGSSQNLPPSMGPAPDGIESWLCPLFYGGLERLKTD